MTDLSRRDLIASAAAALAVSALPAAAEVIAAPASEVVPAWVVGTPGEFDWQHVTGRTAEEAIHNFMCETIGGTGCEEEDIAPETGCECEWCSTIGGLEAERKPAWDGIAKTTPADWLRAGLGTICCRCGYETFPEEGGHPVSDKAICEECMTTADWDVVDPSRAAEMRGIAG